MRRECIMSVGAHRDNRYASTSKVSMGGRFDAVIIEMEGR